MCARACSGMWCTALTFSVAILALGACSSSVDGTGSSAGSGTSSSGSSGDTSDSGASDTSDSDAGTSSGVPPAAATVTIDGKLIPVEEAEIWAETTATGQYSLFIRIKGGGYPSGSDIHVLAVREGLGCEIGGNELWLRPEGDEQFATHKPSCGLNISRLPRTAVGRFVGSFNGSVDAINGAPRSLSLGVTFDVPRRP